MSATRITYEVDVPAPVSQEAASAISGVVRTAVDNLTGNRGRITVTTSVTPAEVDADGNVVPPKRKR